MDDIPEDTEMFAVTLTSSDPAVSLQNTRAVVFIEDSNGEF